MNSDQFECGGYHWRYCFLKADSRLTDSERTYLMFQTAEMYLENEDKRKVVMDTLDGRIITQGRQELLGHYGGQHYDAQVENARGKMNLAFLIIASLELEEEIREHRQN